MPLDDSTGHHLEEVCLSVADFGVAFCDGSNGAIMLNYCRVSVAAERFPEICDAESAFLEMMTGGTVERHQHILKGCNACEYQVTARNT